MNDPELRHHLNDLGCPLSVWDEYFLPLEDCGSTNLVFIAVNGEDPSSDLWGRLKQIWPKGKPLSLGVASSLEEYDANNPRGAVRDKATGEYGDQVDIKLIKKSDSEYEWGYSRYGGPLNANFAWGSFVKTFGYWITIRTGGGES